LVLRCFQWNRSPHSWSSDGSALGSRVHNDQSLWPRIPQTLHQTVPRAPPEPHRSTLDPDRGYYGEAPVGRRRWERAAGDAAPPHSTEQRRAFPLRPCGYLLFSRDGWPVKSWDLAWTQELIQARWTCWWKDFEVLGKPSRGRPSQWPGCKVRAKNAFTSVHTSSSLELAMQQGIGNRQ